MTKLAYFYPSRRRNSRSETTTEVAGSWFHPRTGCCQEYKTEWPLLMVQSGQPAHSWQQPISRRPSRHIYPLACRLWGGRWCVCLMAHPGNPRPPTACSTAFTHPSAVKVMIFYFEQKETSYTVICVTTRNIQLRPTFGTEQRILMPCCLCTPDAAPWLGEGRTWPLMPCIVEWLLDLLWDTPQGFVVHG